jgi:hypothetical protein
MRPEWPESADRALAVADAHGGSVTPNTKRRRGGKSPRADVAPTLPAFTAWPPPVQPVEPIDPAPPEHYVARPARPIAQLAARTGLWAAVALGCVGGCVGMLRPTPEVAAPVAADAADDPMPAPVAGVAERAVAAWLIADADDQESLDELFVEPPAGDAPDTEGLSVVAADAVAGRATETGGWTVTVAVEVIEAGRAADAGDLLGDGAGADAAVSDPAGTPTTGADATGSDDPTVLPTTATWYVEVAVVGSAASGLQALTTPAIVPAPAAAGDGWKPDREGAEEPDPSDPIVATIEGFFAALLTGQGDPARYLSPGVQIGRIDPAPFVGISVSHVEIRHGRNSAADLARAWVDVEVTTARGARQVLAYELVLAERQGRWEVREMAGVRPGTPPTTTTTTATTTTPGG